MEATQTQVRQAVSAATSGTGGTARRAATKLTERVGDAWTVGVLAIIVVVFGFVASDFYSQANWLATSLYATQILLLALGQTFVIVTGGIDLSDGAALGFSSMFGAWVVEHLWAGGMAPGGAVAIGFAACIGAGSMIGLINGLVIARLNLSPFIVTLGMLGVATGATSLVHNGNEITNLPLDISSIGNKVFFGNWLPLPVLITIVFCAFWWVVLRRTRFGRRTYAIGSNMEGVRRAGINVNRHLIRVYLLSGAMAGVAGLLLLSRFATASPVAGDNAELNAIAAVIIGGASLNGGRGSILGTIVGALIISVLDTGLILANVAPFWQLVAVGAIIIGAVYIDQLRLKIASW